MKFAWAAAVAATLVLSGCASVPPEVVTLSSVSANDTRALHEGYRTLIRKHFETLKRVREQEFADKILAPYIEDAIAQGRLIDVIQGKVVWDAAADKFVAPDPARATIQKLDTLATWNRQVAADIEGLRRDAFSDLDQQQIEVLASLDAAFDNVNRGNTAVHAYLLSLQKVDAAQNEFFRTVGMEDFPKKLSDALDRASQDAGRYSQRVNSLDKKATELKGKINGGR